MTTPKAHAMLDTDFSGEHLVLSSERDLERATSALAAGCAVAHGFGNFYAITARPDAAAVERINVLKGRPPQQVGSVVTTPLRAARLFDWSRLPDGLSANRVFDLMERLFALGPIGFRGPAAAHLPEHLTSWDGPIRTTQIIFPGQRCPSNAFFSRAMQAIGSDFLYTTSGNRSRHQTGAEDEPVHYRGEAIAQAFWGAPGFLVLRHADEARTLVEHPLHDPMSTTILAFHRLDSLSAGNNMTLIMERHGSLPFSTLEPIVNRMGYGLALSAKAAIRLAQRDYGA